MSTAGVQAQIKSEKAERLQRLLLLRTLLSQRMQEAFGALISAEDAKLITDGKPAKIAIQRGTTEAGCTMIPLAEGSMTFQLISNEPASLQILKTSIQAYFRAYEAWRPKEKNYELMFELEVDNIDEIKPLLQSVEPQIKIGRIVVKDENTGFRELTQQEVDAIRNAPPAPPAPLNTSTNLSPALI